MTGTRLIVAALTLLIGAVAGTWAYACYCEDRPFREVAPGADFVVLGVVAESKTWRASPDEKCVLGTRGWHRSATITQTVKGKAPEGAFAVGGGTTSCDLYPAVLETGRTYAFAFSANEKVPNRSFYWVRMCSRNFEMVAEPGKIGGASMDQIKEWAKSK